jgi:hypothetical protein
MIDDYSDPPTEIKEGYVGPMTRLEGVDEAPIGQTTFFEDIELARRAESALLTDRFVVPPFTTLLGDAGYWQARKGQWLALGIQSELGRGMSDLEGVMAGHGPTALGAAGRVPSKADIADKREFRGASYGGASSVNAEMSANLQRRSAERAERAKAFRGANHKSGASSVMADYSTARPVKGGFRNEADRNSNITGAPPLPEWADNGVENMAPGTSIFDPVLCELAYRWFCPPGGSVLDPFAGGSVRGIVAAMLKHRYTGIDLNARQVEANRQQADTLLEGGDYPPPVWIAGDSSEMPRLLSGSESYDLVFSCPPYFDLEVYTDLPNDLSNLDSYDEFIRVYRLIIGLAVERLRMNRNAVWVVGEIRDKRGYCRGFVPDTVKEFQAAGAQLYNDAVFIQPRGTLPLRVPRQFMAGRKMGRNHQSVLVFWKGDREPKAEDWAGLTERSIGL